MAIAIWGRSPQTGKAEKIDEAEKKDLAYTMREYRIAFGDGWTIWSGRLKDEPKPEQDKPEGPRVSVDGRRWLR